MECAAPGSGAAEDSRGVRRAETECSGELPQKALAALRLRCFAAPLFPPDGERDGSMPGGAAPWTLVRRNSTAPFLLPLPTGPAALGSGGDPGTVDENFYVTINAKGA